MPCNQGRLCASFHTLVYLQENEINSIISPSVAGIKDPILLSLVSNLQELNLKRSRLNYSMESQNPVMSQVQIEIDQTIGALIANVKNLISTTELQDKDLNSRILVMEDMFSSLPASERQMLTIQREYGIHDKMFTILLEKRVEAGITKAANQSDHKVINPARDFGDLPVSPNKSLRYAIALILAFIVPLSYILLKDFFKSTISSFRRY